MNTEKRKATIKKLSAFFLELFHSEALSATSLPISSQTLWSITIRSIVISFFSCFWSLRLFCSLSPFQPVLSSFRSHFRSHFTSHHACLFPLCVSLSFALPFPVLSLIWNHTSMSLLPLCPPSLTVIVLSALLRNDFGSH